MSIDNMCSGSSVRIYISDYCPFHQLEINISVMFSYGVCVISAS